MWIKLLFIGCFFIVAVGYLILTVLAFTPWGLKKWQKVDEEQKRMDEEDK